MNDILKNHLITVEIVYAMVDNQYLIKHRITQGLTIRDLLSISYLPKLLDLKHKIKLDLTTIRVGIFGKEVSLNQILKDKDRVEIYRPLVCDPKQRRRETIEKKKKANGKQKKTE